MIFSDDSDFRKAKRALMITSSIAVLMVVTGLPIEKVNFGIIVFNLEGSRGIYWFLLGVLVYSSITFYLRGRVTDLEKKIIKAEKDHIEKDKLQDQRSTIQKERNEQQMKPKSILGELGFGMPGPVTLTSKAYELDRKLNDLNVALTAISLIDNIRKPLWLLDYIIPLMYGILSSILLLTYLLFM